MLAVKNPPANAEDVKDTDSIPGSGRSPGGGYGNPLQDSCIVVVAQGPIQPQGKPVPLPAAEDGACVIFQTHNTG